MASGFHQETNRNCCDGVDRISSLPDKAISEILVCLPIKEAVGTSKLSRTWRYRWMSLPELVFDQHACAGGQPSDDQRVNNVLIFDQHAYAGGQSSDDQRVSFINNVLFLHDGDITKFEIKGLSRNASSPYVDRWLLLLSRKKLTKLMINFRIPNPNDNPYVCHTCIFYCEALSTLKLQFCGLQLPPPTQFNGFESLTVLDLLGVDANKETIEFLVNTSPLLEILSITLGCSETSNLNISALNLRKCVINVNYEGIITFVKTPELRDTDIRVGRFSWLDEIVGGLDKIQKAAFSHPYIEAWRKNFTFHHLNHLKLEIDFEDPQQVLGALWLSKSSPSLKTIDIRVNHPESIGRQKRRTERNLDAIPKLQELYDLLDESKDVLQSLETFELERFGGYENELRFIQFFLLHASVLQTMKIGLETDENTSCLIKGGAWKELVQFQRASSGVKVKLYDLKD